MLGSDSFDLGKVIGIKPGSDLFDEVYNLVINWKPQKRYRDHQGYRDDLLKFLRKNRPYPIEVKKEAGGSRCDIGVAKSVGIELKKDLKTKAEVDRLMGQLNEYRREYPLGLIVVLVGNTDEDRYDDVKTRVSRMVSEHSSIFGGLRIKVVNKGSLK